jgi:tetratricopeptide (TPR) repeat protein
MTRRWRDGQRPRTEDYFLEYPELRDGSEAALELLYEEICLRREYGDEVQPGELLERFPHWSAQVEVLLRCHDLLDPGPSSFPQVGEEIDGFRLLAELGGGARGRAFLAAEQPLGGRLVVLKLSPQGGDEHLSLARLQHTHIVPLYSVHDFLDRDLRGLCMPYFGGATLARLLQYVRDIAPGRRHGRDLAEALRRSSGDLPTGLTPDGPGLELLAATAYDRVICEIGVCLADALQYAHQHGLVHLDVKPSNVLLAADGTPLLLDFHLAQPPLPAGSLMPHGIGGTRLYMPPEQQAALAAAREGRSIPAAIDHRADLFALAVVLSEALGGGLSASPGLKAVLARCLARDPDERYPDAGSLASDLRRHLNDLPLREVPNRSLGERWRKWRRRQPLALAIGGVLVTLAAGAALLVGQSARQLELAQDALDDGRKQLREHLPGLAVEAFRRGLALAEGVPFSDRLTGELHEQLAVAQRVQVAGELHACVEQLRGLDDTDGIARPALLTVEEQCRRFWDQRHLIGSLLASDDGTEHAWGGRIDMLDLVVLWIDLRVHLANKDQRSAVHREALTVLDEAEKSFGPSCVLHSQRRVHLAPLGMPAPTESGMPAPATAWEHYAVGRALLRADDPVAALAHLERAVQMQPDALWAHFTHAKCAFQLGRLEEAISSFTACVALAPTCAGCYHNRARVYAALGQIDRAQRDDDRARQLDATLPSAIRP